MAVYLDGLVEDVDLEIVIKLQTAAKVAIKAGRRIQLFLYIRMISLVWDIAIMSKT